MQVPSRAQVMLSQAAQQTLIEDVCQRKNIEACGILIGEMSEQGNWHVRQACPLPNIFDSAVYFEFAPEDLIAMDLAYPGQLIGAYHSHPTGFAAASETDLRNMEHVNLEMRIPWVWLIICGPFDEHYAEQARHCLTAMPILAYHHYELEGLQQITILAEQARIP